MKNRRVYNLKILIVLFKIFCKCKDLRFMQILYDANLMYLTDNYSQEPKATYEYLDKFYNELKV